MDSISSPLHIKNTETGERRSGGGLWESRKRLIRKAPTSRKLIDAVKARDTSKVAHLLTTGVDPLDVDQHDRSSLSYALANHHEEVVRLLLESLGDKIHTHGETKDMDILSLIQSKWPSAISSKDRGSLLEFANFIGTHHTNTALEITPTWSGYVHCQWEIPAVLEELAPHIGRIPTHDDLGRFVTLSGSDGVFKCTTCNVFLQEQWGETVATEAMTLVYKAIEFGGMQRYTLPGPTRISSMDTPRNVPPPFTDPIQATESQVTFLVKGYSEHKPALVAAIVWLCSAIRSNPSRANVSTSPREKMYSSKAYLKTKIMGRNFQMLGFCLEPLCELPPESSDTSSQCWAQVFRTGIVASYDLGRRPETGMEMPFEMMVHLAAVENYHSFDNGTILLGFSTALVPISRDSQTGIIRWHFETRDETGQSRLSPRDLDSVQRTWFQTKDIEVLRQSRCILGWVDHANILLGTYDLLKQKQMEWSSGLRRQIRTAHRKGIEVGGQISIGVGPITITPNLTNAWIFHSNIQFYSPSQQYGQALHLCSGKVAVVIDSGTKQAWLVPLLSLILHLCHVYFHHVQPSEVDPIPFAEPATNGSRAVIEAIKTCGDLIVVGTDTSDGEAFRQLFLRIHTNLLETSRTREKPNKKYVFASELMDIVCEPGIGSPLKKIEISGNIGSWDGLLEEVDVIGCCANIGQLIEPPVLPPSCNCSILPRDQYLLAAHMQCLEQLSQRVGSSINHLRKGSCRFGENTFWYTESLFWAKCQDRIHMSIWENTAPNRLRQQITRGEKRRKGDEAQGFTVLEDLSLDGAVVFGTYLPKPIGWERKVLSFRDRVLLP